MGNEIGYIGKDGAWKEAISRYVGKDGEWKKQLWKFIGHQGYWRLQHIDSVINRDAVFFLTGAENFELEGGNNLFVFGDGFKWTPYPYPRVGLFLPLETNVADIFENFANATMVGAPVYDSKGPDVNETTEKGLYCETSSDWLELPVGDAGVDMQGIVGTSGDKSFTLAAWFYLDSLPASGEVKCLYDIGGYKNHILLCVDSAGQFIFEVSTRGVITQLISSNVISAQIWYRVIGIMDRDSGVLKLIVDGALNTVEFTSLLGFTTDTEEKKVLLAARRTFVASGSNQYWATPPITAYVLTEGPPNEIDVTGTTSYKYCQTSISISPNTGKYYFEIEVTAMDGVMWLGLCDTTDDSTAAIGISSYSFTSMSRKFNHQTGGGTTYASGAATWAAGDIVGFIYDSDEGSLTAYINGTAYAVFAAGTIVNDVYAVFCSDNVGHIISYATESQWTNAPTDQGTLNPLPDPLVYTATPAGSVGVCIKNAYFGNYAVDDFNIDQLLTAPKCSILFVSTDIIGKPVYVPNNYMGTYKEDRFNFIVPESLPAGNYIFLAQANQTESVALPAVIKEPSSLLEEYITDFSDEAEFCDKWFFMHKGWGGANGGVVKENVLFKSDGIHFVANGDLYTGDIQGTDKYGKPKYHTNSLDPLFGEPWTTRVGGCIVFKQKTGYGSYKCRVKIPTQLGVCAAMWTFFYNEVYPGSPYYDDFQTEGLHAQGSDEDGYYIVRNHEIDIELPSHLDGGTLSDPSWENMKCNTWRGELQNWDVDPSDTEYWEEYRDNLTEVGQSLADGEFHELRFDWYADRVEFFVDDVLKRTNTNTDAGDTIPDIAGHFTVGLWFPSSPLASKDWLVNPDKAWAGGTVDTDGGMKAMWEQQEMIMTDFSFTPFTSESGLRNLGETYPFGIYRTKRV
jgi:hypothetical protein